MELRQYWHVLARRRNVVRNTFIVVAVLAFVSVAYSYYNAQWLGTSVVGLQVQPNRIPNSTVDPLQAADINTTTAEDDLINYAGTTDYFKAVSRELSRGFQTGQYHTRKDWTAIRLGLSVFPASNGHAIWIQWKSAKSAEAVDVVQAAAVRLIDYVPIYHAQLRPNSPAIKTTYLNQANAVHFGLSKPASDFVLRAALGLVAGIILAFLFEYLDDTVQDAADVQHWLGVPTLAVIPGGRQARRARSA